ncbi:DMT family transporter [Alkaliphilus peptidifermentans]|uniref:Uncharacterized membrane protein YdcZ, DUF606 family n=1 Tax=Alkaliphilus peptidifermentans DSM 18978 TaxID=1120976 RepID=A0A1G5KT03_9FIRM|nr:DMT family transporter [Alkaliphilus peptidifermentans]SCZ03230.1 Uncharacterized membrane protein YdcZ, DUF606 family [Alkaliphilus peptidifermentans DSM 18978]
MELIAIILAVIMGGLFIIIKSLNMMLGNKIGIYGSNLVNHLTGIIGSSIIYFTVTIIGFQKLSFYNNVPLYAFIGGIIGSTFVILSNYSFSKTTVVTSTILILCGQFISSIVIDIFILNLQIKPTAIAGAVLIVIGTILYSAKSSGTRNNSQLSHEKI